MIKRLLFLFFILFSFQLLADDVIPEPLNPPRLVNNFSKELPEFLSPSERDALERKLVAFNDSTSNQIVIVIVDDLKGYEPYEFASKLGNKWGIGQKELKNGVVVLIKPTGGQGNRKIFISPSPGLQGAIPDAVTNQIVSNEIVPQFKNGNFYLGLDEATDVLMSLAVGEYKYTDYAKSSKSTKGKGTPLFAFFIVFIFIIFRVITSKRRKYTIGRGGGYYSGGWVSSGGGSWGGGSSGGGFGGFGGGGGFNGGGSGGSW